MADVLRPAMIAAAPFRPRLITHNRQGGLWIRHAFSAAHGHLFLFDFCSMTIAHHCTLRALAYIPIPEFIGS